MNSSSDILKLNAFVDGELSLEDQLILEERLREEPRMRTQVEQLRATREVVHDRATYHGAPPELHEHIRALVTPAARPQPRTRWLAWRPGPAAFAAFAAAVLAINLALLAPREEQRIEQDVVASHVRATLGQRWVDVASSDHHTVKPWLSARLDFSPPVVELDADRGALLGGRVDYIGGHPVAALAYRYGGHMADEFVWPASGKDHPVSMSSSRGFNVAHWTRSGMTHWLISDLNAAELAQFARTLASRERAGV